MDAPNLENADKSHSGRYWGAGWLWLALSVVLYVLSVGPAVRIHDNAKSASVRSAIEVFYTPLELIQWTPLSRPLQAWIQWWRRGL